jgi:hypothetical protein
MWATYPIFDTRVLRESVSKLYGLTLEEAKCTEYERARLRKSTTAQAEGVPS